MFHTTLGLPTTLLPIHTCAIGAVLPSKISIHKHHTQDDKSNDSPSALIYTSNAVHGDGNKHRIPWLALPTPLGRSNGAVGARWSTLGLPTAGRGDAAISYTRERAGTFASVALSYVLC